MTVVVLVAAWPCPCRPAPSPPQPSTMGQQHAIWMLAGGWRNRAMPLLWRSYTMYIRIGRPMSEEDSSYLPLPVHHKNLPTQLGTSFSVSAMYGSRPTVVMVVRKAKKATGQGGTTSAGQLNEERGREGGPGEPRGERRGERRSRPSPHPSSRQG